MTDTRLAAVDRLVEHAANARYDALSPQAVLALKTFTLDSLGVGISGSRVEFAPRLEALAADGWGGAGPCRVLGSTRRLPAPAAAMLNGWQIHNQEFDCVHEAAVVHPMATILSVMLAVAEREGGIGGRELMTAVSTAVDVATVLGMASDGELRFFRPAVCGGLGAAVAAVRMLGGDARQMRDALGLAYSQACGTMQAHVEGSPTLAMQIGFNARNAVMAVDLARAGFAAPHDVLEGPYGLFALFERGGALASALQRVGQPQILAVSHKPFPTGRAAHGALDALSELRAAHGFSAADVARVRLRAPPLILRLVERPAHAAMTPAYARLCLGYAVACLLIDGAADVDCYDDDKLRDPARLALASRVELELAPGAPNALTPQHLQLWLHDGRHFEVALPTVLGSPERPLSRRQHLDKFRRCCASARRPLPASRIEALIGAVDELERCGDVRTLMALAADGDADAAAGSNANPANERHA